METRSSDAEVEGDATTNESQKRSFIDVLPTELLEQVICLGASGHRYGGPEVKWVSMWQRVSRKWVSVINSCPTLWSSITIRYNAEHLEKLLEKSKGAPLDIWIDYPHPQGMDWIQLLVNNAHRWRSINLFENLHDFMARLDRSPSILRELRVGFTHIPHDCILFNPISPELRKLRLFMVTIPHSFNPHLGLEELYLIGSGELEEDTGDVALSINKVHQFLQGNPNLRILRLEGGYKGSPNQRNLQPINLTKLEEVEIKDCQVLHLFQAERCVKFRFRMNLIEEKPSLNAWTTFAHALKRVERLKIVIRDGSLDISCMDRLYGADIELGSIQPRGGDSGPLTYSILEDILNESEKVAPISARVELALFTANKSDSGFDVGLEVLKLLQTPITPPPSDHSRWRIPNLDTLVMLDPGLPYRSLQAFVQARSDGHRMKATSPITGIFTQNDSSDDEGHRKNVLSEVMAYLEGGNAE